MTMGSEFSSRGQRLVEQGAMIVPGTTVCIQPTCQVARKIIKIVPYGGSGGFAVAAPYHRERRGWVIKAPFDYTQRNVCIHASEMVEYSASDRVKLSIHPDGFAQFSSENPHAILSGRDPTTRYPRGMGVLVNQFTRPISSGPTFGVTAWGLEDFDESTASSRDDVVTFTDDELYYRNSTPGTANAFMIEGFIFPETYWAGVRRRAGVFHLAMARPDFEARGAVLDLRILPLPGQPVLLGLLASATRVNLGASSGFQLMGPGDGTGTLLAVYPAPPGAEPKMSLDYTRADGAPRAVGPSAPASVSAPPSR